MHSLIRTALPPRVLHPELGGPRLFGRCIRHTDWPHDGHGFTKHGNSMGIHQLSRRWTALLRPSTAYHQCIDRFYADKPSIQNLTTKTGIGSRAHNPLPYQHIDRVWCLSVLSTQHGTCPGKSLCIGGTELCLGSYHTPEVCNGMDDDCDGDTDEDLVGCSTPLAYPVFVSTTRFQSELILYVRMSRLRQRSFFLLTYQL